MLVTQLVSPALQNMKRHVNKYNTSQQFADLCIIVLQFESAKRIVSSFIQLRMTERHIKVMKCLSLKFEILVIIAVIDSPPSTYQVYVCLEMTTCHLQPRSQEVDQGHFLSSVLISSTLIFDFICLAFTPQVKTALELC